MGLPLSRSHALILEPEGCQNHRCPSPTGCTLPLRLLRGGPQPPAGGCTQPAVPPSASVLLPGLAATLQPPLPLCSTRGHPAARGAGSWAQSPPCTRGSGAQSAPVPPSHRCCCQRASRPGPLRAAPGCAGAPAARHGPSPSAFRAGRQEQGTEPPRPHPRGSAAVPRLCPSQLLGAGRSAQPTQPPTRRVGLEPRSHPHRGVWGGERSPPVCSPNRCPPSWPRCLQQVNQVQMWRQGRAPACH